jgi:pilus assembly protein Flp/PilA
MLLDYILIKTGLNGMIARRNEEGASAVEYGLLVAGIAALVVAVVFLFGDMISGVFNETCSTIQADGAAGTGTCAATP